MQLGPPRPTSTIGGHVALALIDANAFYVSCELLFQPWLRGRAAVVASNTTMDAW